MKVVAIVEARMRSKRLAEKVILPLSGKPLLQVLIEQLRYCKTLDQVVIATTINREDEKIIGLAKKFNVGWFRGSEEDVLSRVLGAARKYRADVIVELTGDNPLIDPEIIDEAVNLYRKSKAEAVVNNLSGQKFPRGQSVKVLSTVALARIDKKTSDPIDREHVSIYFFEHKDEFKIRELLPKKDWDRPEIRLTVDTGRDLELVRRVYHLLYPRQPIKLADIVNIFDRFPKLLSINADIKHKKSRYGRADEAKIARQMKLGILSYRPKWRVGIVGCGNIASLFDNDPARSFVATHAGGYNTDPEVELTAVADIDEEKRRDCQRRWDAPRSYPTAEEMFAKEKLDIVSVTTPIQYHAPVVLAAIKHRIPVIFCEKPFTNSAETAAKLVKLAKQAGVKLLVNYNRRFDPMMRKLSDRIKNGEFGKFVGGIHYYVNGWVNNGCHALDLIQMLIGPIKTVKNVGSNPPNVDASAEFEDGGRVFIQGLPAAAPRIFETDLLFTAGRIRLERVGRQALIYRPEERLMNTKGKWYQTEPAEIMEGNIPESFPAAVGHFVELLKHPQMRPWSPGENGISVLRFLAAAGGEKVLSSPVKSK